MNTTQLKALRVVLIDRTREQVAEVVAKSQAESDKACERLRFLHAKAFKRALREGKWILCGEGEEKITRQYSGYYNDRNLTNKLEAMVAVSLTLAERKELDKLESLTAIKAVDLSSALDLLMAEALLMDVKTIDMKQMEASLIKRLKRRVRA